MKKILLLALAGALTLGSFAADKGKKSKKVVKTEQVCTPNCPPICQQNCCSKA